MSNHKKFSYTRDDMRHINNDITDLFALEALSEDEEDDLEDYDPENDVDEVDDDDDDEYDSEIDGDEDPAEDEDDDYDDVVEHVGIDNMEEILSIEELDAEDLMKARATEDAIAIAFDSAPDDEHRLLDRSCDKDVFGVDFSDDDVKQEDSFDSEYFND